MDTSVKNEFTVQGIAASQGIAYGQIFVYIQSDVEVPSYQVEPEKRIEEVARFEKALLVTRQQIAKIQDEVERNLGPEEALIFDAHLLVLEDQALIGETIREFETTGRNIETCFNKVSQRYIKAFSEIDDEYLRERAGDIRDVAQRVLQNLLGQAENSLTRLADKRIVVANDISPSDSASIDRSAALGIVTDTGSKTSHAVIVARSMKVPAVVGLRDLSHRVKHGDWAIIDGYDGVVIVNPSESTLFRYGKIQEQKKTFESRLLKANQEPAVTLDGVPVTLMANIEKPDEVKLVRDYNAAGVGLYRTEYLFLSSSRVPSEQEQFLAYKAVAEGLAPNPVVIRTLDLGGDKPMAGNPELFPKEDNPFMGFRAIRFCLEHQDIFRDQLRAILMASAYGKVKIMYPMISGHEELARANAVLADCMSDLKSRGVPFDENIPVGAMIEVPSAAETADLLAPDCAFFSIGTNDLIQYILAIDRVNDRIAHLYEPTHCAVLRTLRRIVAEGHRGKLEVSVCGEMAGDPVYAPLLLGMGIDCLSMAPPWIPSVKYIVRAMTMADARALAEEALQMNSPREIYAKCEAFYRARVSVD
ncbi:phosphoenolpyruvate--protein phosphotransferase [Opitutus terrae]|uniref:Phosphoenolpyruvate-protein phosphotransferase n=1 Tax=Opitutus terrae (strain DSM 11246 / JCM 15787 / PB90-1) TaxID=452637 RepID=B1ZSC6_OPITP|nr:phosphoenolpyruvate--protein phosphotransferase [Opitutus terrae]ACB75725.1 phosphoenolpyruvate-protein phosphotransferase [Opitutus terrae PB90-1]